MTLGECIRHRRLELYATDKRFSLRQVAGRLGIEPSYLSKVERGENAPLSEARLLEMARELDLDADKLLMLCGKIPSDITDALRARPSVMWSLIRHLNTLSDEALDMMFHDGATYLGFGDHAEARQAG